MTQRELPICLGRILGQCENQFLAGLDCGPVEASPCEVLVSAPVACCERSFPDGLLLRDFLDDFYLGERDV